MPIDGPWIQPADQSAAGEGVSWVSGLGIYEADVFVASGSPSPDFASSWAHPVSGGFDWKIAEFVNRNRFSGQTEWKRTMSFAAVDLDLVMSALPNVGPTPIELAQPHVIGYEFEHPHGTPLFPVSINFAFTSISTLGFQDDVQHKTTSPPPDIMQGDIELRRVAPGDYVTPPLDASILAVDAWASAAQQAAWPVISSQAILAGKTVATSSDGPGLVDNVVEATPVTTAAWSISYAASDLDDARRLPIFLTLSRWAAAAVLAEPAASPVSSAYKGNFGGIDDFTVTLQATVSLSYTPPRYRLIYDIAPPQRQFPRDDGLGISGRRSWPPPTSKQYGLRRGASATYQ